jgi:hypothetical protein
MKHAYCYMNHAKYVVIVSTEYYKFMPEHFVAIELHHRDLPVRFQQDGATANTA